MFRQPWLIGILTTSSLLAGCIPFADQVWKIPEKEKQLGVALTKPTTEATVRENAEVQIEWTGSNLTGQPATISVILESRQDLSLTTLVNAKPLTSESETGSTTWDVDGFAGPYQIIIRLNAGNQQAEARSNVLITVDPQPKFRFSTPTGDATFTPGQEPPVPLTIAWEGTDNEATARIGLDTDITHVTPPGQNDEDDQDDDDQQEDNDDPNQQVGNEIFLTQVELTNTIDPDESSLQWTGNDEDGQPVPAGDYHLFAIVSDGVNPDLIVPGLGLITVAEAPEEEPEEEEEEEEVTGLAILEPAEDTSFLAGTLQIKYQLDRTTDALVTLRIDADDDHSNGNEITIRDETLVEADTEPDPFDWNGNDTDGNPVPDGIYSVYVTAAGETGSPATAEGEGLILRRSVDQQPLIAILAPASRRTVEPGDNLTIRWRDDDPAESAVIRIVLDDDNDPLADTADQIELLAGRAAKGDGVEDRTDYQIKTTDPPGTYYVIAYIDKENDGVADDTAVGPVIVEIDDPTD